jgi:hypothetical protein
MIEKNWRTRKLIISTLEKFIKAYATLRRLTNLALGYFVKDEISDVLSNAHNMSIA